MVKRKNKIVLWIDISGQGEECQLSTRTMPFFYISQLTLIKHLLGTKHMQNYWPSQPLCEPCLKPILFPKKKLRLREINLLANLLVSEAVRSHSLGYLFKIQI